MKNLNGTALVAVSETQQSADGRFAPDVNGLKPVFLNVIAGTIPNRNMLSGTVADGLGLKAGKTYLVQINEKKEDETYGRQFGYVALGEVPVVDLITTISQMRTIAGPPVMWDVEADAPVATFDKVVETQGD